MKCLLVVKRSLTLAVAITGVKWMRPRIAMFAARIDDMLGCFMADLTPELEEQVIDDLTALDWAHDLDSRSTQLISERLGCSPEDAGIILQRLMSNKRVEALSESFGNPAANRKLDSYRWKWVKPKR